MNDTPAKRRPGRPATGHQPATVRARRALQALTDDGGRRVVMLGTAADLANIAAIREREVLSTDTAAIRAALHWYAHRR